LGVVTFAYLPNGPQDAHWLTDEERRWLKDRLAKDRLAETASRHPPIRQVFANPRTWVFCALYFLIVLGLYSISFWLPQILKGLSGSSDFLVGVLSALPYIVAALGFLLSTQTQVPALAVVSISLAALGIWGSLGPFWAMSTSVLTASTAAA